ncbi:TPA: hypothetical protein NOE89_000908 [Pseudomonas aeruginosa]|nr:hypothetical protein [Pseudomonas aeruginosa]
MQDSASLLRIYTRNKAYSRVYTSQYELHISEYGLSPNAWMYSLLKSMSERTRIEPLHNSKYVMFKNTLDIAIRTPGIKRYLELEVCKLTASDMRLMFDLVETELEKIDRTDSTKYKLTQEFRSVILAGIKMLEGCEHLHRKSIGFKTRLQYVRPPREMISDFVEVIEAPSGEDVIGAIRFTDVKDLHQKTYEKLNVDLERIIDACITELEWHEKVRKEFERALALQLSPGLVEMVRGLLRGRVYKGVIREVYEFTGEQLLGAILTVIKEDRLAFSNRSYSPEFEWAIPLKTKVLSSMGFSLYKSEHFYLLGYRLSSDELRAIFNLLLCHTGWNSGSLIEMERAEVQRTGGDYVIRGFKAKTGDYTPPVYIDKYCRGGGDALNKLIWNKDSLIECGLVSGASTNFWYGWGRGFHIHEKQSIGLFVSNKSFTNRHGLPDYSFDQIRTQVMSKSVLMSSGNIEVVRRGAGHLGSVTTAKYLDQPIFRRIASSVNFDFQSKLEAAVIWDLMQKGEIKKGRSNIDVSRRLKLVPVGDGASCVSPSNPPAGIETFDGMCRGESCHKSGGCENRVIHINVAALEALILKKKYFQNSWQRLYLANSHKFESVYAPAMLFNLALYEFISTSNYSGFLKKIEKELCL